VKKLLLIIVLLPSAVLADCNGGVASPACNEAYGPCAGGMDDCFNTCESSSCPTCYSCDWEIYSCQPVTSWCGNSQCECWEDTCNCPGDCAGYCCGNQSCEGTSGEDCSNCAADCGECPTPTPTPCAPNCGGTSGGCWGGSDGCGGYCWDSCAEGYECNNYVCSELPTPTPTNTPCATNCGGTDGACNGASDPNGCGIYCYDNCAEGYTCTYTWSPRYSNYGYWCAAADTPTPEPTATICTDCFDPGAQLYRCDWSYDYCAQQYCYNLGCNGHPDTTCDGTWCQPNPTPTPVETPTPIVITCAEGETLTDNQIPPSGLLAWWRGDDNANDSSGNGRDLTWQGSSQYADGRYGTAFSFDGSAYLSATTQIVNPTGMTVAYWVKTTTGYEYSYRLAAHMSDADNNWLTWGTYVGDCGANEIFFQFQTVGGNDGWKVTDRCAHSFASEEWHHLASTYDGDSVLLTYLDGQQISDQYWGDGYGWIVETANTKINLGSDPTGSQIMMGKIDDFAVWGRVLSVGEIQQVYQQKSCITPTPTPTDTPTPEPTATATPTPVVISRSYGWN
jgi:hypothetical protein